MIPGLEVGMIVVVERWWMTDENGSRGMMNENRIEI
jgi:hypothetical protein